jgi:outer membrane PBP1 activator LpoA protein
MKYSSLTLLTVFSLVLLGCVEPVRKQPDQQQTVESRQEVTSQAQKLLAQADRESDINRKTTLKLQAAQAFFDSKNYDQVRTIIADINVNTLSPESRIRYNLVNAQLALHEQNAQQALTLAPVPRPELPAELRIRSRQIRARAYRQSGNHLQSIQELLTINSLTTDQEVLGKSHVSIWQSLQQLSIKTLRTQDSKTSDPVYKGWLALAIIYQESRFNPGVFQSKLNTWKVSYGQHPASLKILPILAEEQQNLAARPNRIALLLPLGRNSRVVKSIRDGFAAAHYDGKNTSIHIKIYDTSRNGPVAAYQQAVSEGTQIVVGPLLKGNVSKIMQQGQRSIPVLALNTPKIKSGSSFEAPHNMYFFGLSPEDEARQVAERAVHDNKMIAVVLAPLTEWGMRVQRAFTSRYKELGGKVVEYKNYPRNTFDYSKLIQQLLNLDDSKQRSFVLRRTLRTKFEFEPSRRTDAEVVFVAGFPRDLRLIAPQLKFHQARDLPIYTTSHVYSGVVNLRRDKDLNGVIFCGTPWNLVPRENMSSVKRHIMQSAPGSVGKYSRFYALGADAYAVIPYLSWLKKNSGQFYKGQTGQLHIDKNNHVLRKQLWARFVQGRATLLQEE